MEWWFYYVIMILVMVVFLLIGFWMFFYWLFEGWMYVKFLGVVVIFGVYMMYGCWWCKFVGDENFYLFWFFKFMNEVFMLVMILIVIMVIVKLFWEDVCKLLLKRKLLKIVWLNFLWICRIGFVFVLKILNLL